MWLERGGPPGPLDELLLDRLAIAVASVVERYGPARTTMADPALVELVISADSDEAARARALRLLGFAPDLVVRVVAVRSPLPLDRIAQLDLPGPPREGGAARRGGCAPGRRPSTRRGSPPGCMRASAPPGAPARRGGRPESRCVSPPQHEPVIGYDDLGALALLAEIPRRPPATTPTWRRSPGWPAARKTWRTLQAYCATGSLRRAADLLHLHHSSVARRVELLGGVLGIDLNEPQGRTRVKIALTVRRLLEALTRRTGSAPGPCGR